MVSPSGVFSRSLRTGCSYTLSGDPFVLVSQTWENSVTVVSLSLSITLLRSAFSVTALTITCDSPYSMIVGCSCCILFSLDDLSSSAQNVAELG